MQESLIYHEKVTSRKTTALFLLLAIVCGLLFFWRLRAERMDWLAILLLVLACFFLFYTLNYRVLDIQLYQDRMQLKFGVFTWRVPNSNIAQVQPDDHIPWLMRNGGAGIHFMFVHGRYRASYNFLEHPRVVIAFKKRVGPVVDLSFSTRQPEMLIRHLEESIM